MSTTIILEQYGEGWYFSLESPTMVKHEPARNELDAISKAKYYLSLREKQITGQESGGE